MILLRMSKLHIANANEIRRQGARYAFLLRFHGIRWKIKYLNVQKAKKKKKL